MKISTARVEEITQAALEEPCGKTGNFLAGACVRPKGHDGPHADANRIGWMEPTEDEEC